VVSIRRFLRKNSDNHSKAPDREGEAMLTKIEGSGAFSPPTSFSTEQLVDLNNLRYPKVLPRGGQRVRSGWADTHFGIRNRPLDLVEDHGETIKLPYGEGGLYGVDMGTRAASIALRAAGISGQQIGVLIESSATHDTFGVGGHLGHYIRELNLPPHINMPTYMIGCGGFLPTLECAQWALSAGHEYVLVILQNCPSAQFANRELRARYRPKENEKPETSIEKMACYLVFSDAAVAFVLKKDEHSGFLRGRSLTKSGANYRLIDVPIGGGINPPLSSNLDEASYRMKTGNVKTSFPELMVENWRIAKELMGGQVDMTEVGEFVYHQASKPGIRDAVSKCPDVDLSKVHTIMEEMGNPAICSGPLVLHDALTKRRYSPGTKIPLMLLGAAYDGAGYGATVYKV